MHYIIMVYGKLVNGNFFNITDTFHSTETFGLNFQRLPVANGRDFSKISKIEDNLMRYPKIFKNFFLKLFFSFNFAPIIDRTFG